MKLDIQTIVYGSIDMAVAPFQLQHDFYIALLKRLKAKLTTKNETEHETTTVTETE